MFKGRKSGREISAPHGVMHGVHVDKDFEWSGPDAATQFVFGEKLGEGSFGAVFRASHKNSGIEMAIKTIPVLDNDDLGDIKHEIDILKVCFFLFPLSFFPKQTHACIHRDLCVFFLPFPPHHRNAHLQTL